MGSFACRYDSGGSNHHQALFWDRWVNMDWIGLDISSSSSSSSKVSITLKNRVRVEDSPEQTFKEPIMQNARFYNFQLGPTSSPKNWEYMQIPHWSTKATTEFINFKIFLRLNHETYKIKENKQTLLSHYYPYNRYCKMPTIWHSY